MNVPILIHTGISISDVLDLAEPSFCEKHLKKFTAKCNTFITVFFQLPFLSIAQPRQNKALSWTSQFSTEVRRSIRNKSPPMSLKYSLTKSEIRKSEEIWFYKFFKKKLFLIYKFKKIHHNKYIII